jgi:hypothetical protein
MTKDLTYLVVKEVEENEDGSAEVTFLMDDKTKDVIVEEGLRFILTCAAAKLDIEYALEILMNYKDDADVE